MYIHGEVCDSLIICLFTSLLSIYILPISQTIAFILKRKCYRGSDWMVNYFITFKHKLKSDYKVNKGNNKITELRADPDQPIRMHMF